jgi:hypothetical protein
MGNHSIKGGKSMEQGLLEVKTIIEGLAEKIGAPLNMLPTYGYSEETARPEIQLDASGYHFVVSERGQETERHTTFDLDEILYDVFDGVTFAMACTYELNHRLEGQDFRRILFSYQEGLMTQLSPAWGNRNKLELNKVFEQYPFEDETAP